MELTYADVLEYCMEEGIQLSQDDMDEIKYVVETGSYDDPYENTNNYADMLEFFVENGVQLNSDQISALQEATAAIPGKKYLGLPGPKQFNKKKAALIGAGVTAAGLAGAAAYRKHKKAKEEEKKKKESDNK